VTTQLQLINIIIIIIILTTLTGQNHIKSVDFILRIKEQGNVFY